MFFSEAEDGKLDRMFQYVAMFRIKRTKRIFIPFLLVSFTFLYYVSHQITGNKVRTARHYVDIRNNRQSAQTADWVRVQNNDTNIFLYSAFYDERILGGRLPVPHVVVIGVWFRIDEPMFCALWAEKDRLLQVPTAKVHAIWKQLRKSNSTFVMHCPILDQVNIVPKYVSIDRNSKRVQNLNSAKISVESPPKPQRKMDFAICLKSVYDLPGGGLKTPSQYLIEWIELNKLLGIKHIYVYNHSMGAEHGKIFRYYAKKKFVDIFSSSNIPGYDVTTDPMPDLIASSNDCLFRFMHSVRRIVHVDTDEIIAPFTLSDLSQLISHVSKMNNASDENPMFQFSNQRYFLDDPQVKPGPFFSQFAVRHVAPEGPRTRPKSIVDASGCLALNSHVCVFRVPGTRVIRVPTDIAASLHYKACATSRVQNKPKNCSDLFLHSVADRSMRRFQKRLEYNVNKVVADMLKNTNRND